MKTFILSVAVTALLSSCGTADNKSETSVNGQKPVTENPSADSRTTIQWMDSTYLDLGKVNEGKVVEVAFRFKNSGDKALVIEKVSPGCGCTVAEVPKEPFAPGQEGVIKAKFDSKNQHLGEHTKVVTVMANTNPSTSHTLNFRVEIVN